MKNFTSTYLKSLKRKLLDEHGNPILTIKYLEEPNEFFYIQPSLEYDLIENKKQLKTPILRESRDVIELKEEGVVICSLPITASTQFYKRQTDYLFLAKIGRVPLGAVTIASILGPNKKGQHRFIFDDANRRVKLSGPNAGPMGEGPWIPLEEN